MYHVKDLYDRHAKRLGLELTAGKAGMNRKIKVPEVQRPGLSLAGYLKNLADSADSYFRKGGNRIYSRPRSKGSDRAP